MAALKVTYKDPHQLKPRARNPHTHTTKQIKLRALKNLDLSTRSSLIAPATVKSVALIADAILDRSKRGGINLDVFAGSGTTPDRSRKGRTAGLRHGNRLPLHRYHHLQVR